MMFKIRPEVESDWDTVRGIHEAAFGREAEAALVTALRAGPAFVPELSLVAEVGGEPVGHILFTRLGLEPEQPDLLLFALAPLAVLPAWQRGGAGSALVREGLARCCALGAAGVVVVGHPEYYPRFGFVSARLLGLEAPFPVPDEAWMALELGEGRGRGFRGVVRYAPEFDTV